MTSSLSAASEGRTPTDCSGFLLPCYPRRQCRPDHTRARTLEELTTTVPGPDHELLHGQGFRRLGAGSQAWLPLKYPDFEVGEV